MGWKDDLPGIDEDEYLAAWAFSGEDDDEEESDDPHAYDAYKLAFGDEMDEDDDDGVE